MSDAFAQLNKPVDGTVDPVRLGMAFAEILSKYLPNGNADLLQKAQTVGAPVGPYVHGPGGLFGVRGLERGVISTHTQIVESLGEVIPIVPSVDMDPLFPYITGFLRSDQQEKNAVCDNPPQAANMKTGILTSQFGRKEFKTRQVELNRIGQHINRGEFFDLSLLNGPLVNQLGGLMQSTYGLSQQAAALGGREILMRMIEVAVAYQRFTCPQVYTGNPSNNSAGGGYKEWMGLDLLISTSKRDAVTGVALPSLYSDVKNFNYGNVATASNPDIVRTITTILRILKRKAVTQNLNPVEFAIVMREPLFYEVTRVWPCIYNTDGCSFPNTAAGGNIVLNDDFQVRMRDDMRNNKYLLVDGARVRVIVDDCIMEETTADNAAIPLGGFSSDIYIVPLSARGGTIRTLYWEYYDYRTAVTPSVSDGRAGSFFWTDSGAFLWGIKPPDNWCVEWISKMEARLILRTPQLAGRLQNVVYIPLQHPDDPLPSQPYHVNGGNSQGYPLPSPYTEANASGPGIPA